MDLNEITMNLVPYPKMHYLVSSITPLYAMLDVSLPPRRSASLLHINCMFLNPLGGSAVLSLACVALSFSLQVGSDVLRRFLSRAPTDQGRPKEQSLSRLCLNVEGESGGLGHTAEH